MLFKAQFLGLVLSALFAIGLAIVPIPDAERWYFFKFILILGFIALVGWCYSMNAEAKASFVRPLVIRVLAHPVDYPPGTVIAGIQWQPGYSDLRIALSNTTSDPYTDLDVWVDTDMGIVEAGLNSEINTCTVSPGIPPFIRARAMGEGPPERPIVHSHYRLHCDKFLPLTEIEMVIAAIRPIWAFSLSGPRFEPKTVHVVATYMGGNQKRKHEETYFPITSISEDKGTS